MSDDGDSFHLDDNDDAEPITAQKVLFSLFLPKLSIQFKNKKISFKNKFIDFPALGIGKLAKHMAE